MPALFLGSARILELNPASPTSSAVAVVAKENQVGAAPCFRTPRHWSYGYVRSCGWEELELGVEGRLKMVEATE